jgi:hypothetical protein
VTKWTDLWRELWVKPWLTKNWHLSFFTTGMYFSEFLTFDSITYSQQNCNYSPHGKYKKQGLISIAFH